MKCKTCNQTSCCNKLSTWRTGQPPAGALLRRRQLAPSTCAPLSANGYRHQPVNPPATPMPHFRVSAPCIRLSSLATKSRHHDTAVANVAVGIGGRQAGACLPGLGSGHLLPGGVESSRMGKGLSEAHVGSTRHGGYWNRQQQPHTALYCVQVASLAAAMQGCKAAGLQSRYHPGGWQKRGCTGHCEGRLRHPEPGGRTCTPRASSSIVYSGGGQGSLMT